MNGELHDDNWEVARREGRASQAAGSTARGGNCAKRSAGESCGSSQRTSHGPAVEPDYIFREGPADIQDESPAHFKDVRLSELFAPGKDRLIVDHMMWGANDKSPCPDRKSTRLNSSHLGIS